MPRTTTIECPGCPPLRALTFDNLGLIKVTEARSKESGNPKVVERWGEPDASKCILAASMDDRKSNPLLAVARKNGIIEVLSPINGNLSFSASLGSNDGNSTQDDNVIGIHLFRKQREDSLSSLLTCTAKGNASLRCFEVPGSAADTVVASPLQSWSVCGSGEVNFCKLDGGENYSLFGGKGVEVNVWDLEKYSKIWTAKPPPKNSLGIFTPTWFTSATFLNKDDHRKFVAGTNSHQIRLYDMSAQRRPVLSVDFREAPIKAVVEDLDGNTVYFGTGAGDLASIDIRTGKMSGCFIGKCSGSIRSIARHPELPVIASCGLDSYLRFWDINSRQLLSAVFLKQHLTNVVFDSNFTDDVIAATTPNQLPDNVVDLNEAQNDSDEEPSVKRKKDEESSVKRKKASRESSGKKQKSKKKTNVTDVLPDNGPEFTVKRKISSKEISETKLTSKKKTTVTGESTHDGEDLNETRMKSEDDTLPVKRKKASKENKATKKLKSKKSKRLKDEIASAPVS